MRKTQKYYPEGFFDILRTEHMNDETIESMIGMSTVVSGIVIAYIAENNNPYLKVDMGNGRIGIIYTSDDAYKNKSLVNEVIHFYITKYLGSNMYLLERSSLVNKARTEILQKYSIGDIVKGKIVAFLGYGVFVDIGWGATALLHKGDILGKPEHPKDVLKNTTFLDVEIKNITEDGNIYVKMIENG